MDDTHFIDVVGDNAAPEPKPARTRSVRRGETLWPGTPAGTIMMR